MTFLRVAGVGGVLGRVDWLDGLGDELNDTCQRLGYTDRRQP